MAEVSRFESRQAQLTCSPETFYSFITDIRHFSSVIPADKMQDWNCDAESCSFRVAALGSVSLKIKDSTRFNLVSFTGNALSSIDFILRTHIASNSRAMASVMLEMEAEISPLLKMLASGAINQFLETMIDEMEKFDKWESPAKENQLL